jgi:glycosyltransferase involved in cell wall biosynthesis
LRVTHVIASLEAGGAQHMLHKIARVQREDGVESTVIGLTAHTPAAETLAGDGFRAYTLGMTPGRAGPGDVVRLTRLLRSTRPDVVQTWMYHADLLAGVLTRLTSAAGVVWGLRGSVDLEHSKSSSIAVARACARTSSVVPHAIISCSEALSRIHTDMGYAAEKIVTIPNGFDLERWQPDPAARADVRAELGLAPDALLVGLVARWDPQKDHATFVRAARRVLAREPGVTFLLAGDRIAPDNPELAALLEAEGLLGDERVRLLGLRRDVERLTAALDLAVSSSAFGEGFHNVLGEAMACGVPCAATDVGDAALVVGDTGTIVPAEDPDALAGAIAALCGDRERLTRLGAAARARVEGRFSIGPVAEQYAAVYRRVHAAAR